MAIVGGAVVPLAAGRARRPHRRAACVRAAARCAISSSCSTGGAVRAWTRLHLRCRRRRLPAIEELPMFRALRTVVAAASLATVRVCVAAPTEPPVDAAESAKLAGEVKTEFLHAWSTYRRYAWGHDELEPLSKKPRDWYGKPLLMTPVDALDTLLLMGLRERSRRGARADRRRSSILRSGHLRQELRDHDPAARRPALELSADRRRAPAAQGRRISADVSCRCSIRRPACRTS